ncbi:MAG TPA: helix-turn-helix transcriptional regulator [Aldersonia sp.]
MAPEDPLEVGLAALAEGRWSDACDALALVTDDDPRALAGWASALWWLGDNDASIERWTRAYTRFRQAGDDESAAHCAVSLAIVYKANYANLPVADGWLARAERLLADREVGTLHGWLWIARGYRDTDLDRAESLTTRALAEAGTDADLALVALSQLGRIRVGRGLDDDGFRLLDEALAAALAGDRLSLDTVAYTCCDMLAACEQAGDLERAARWCAVADRFTQRYGCPFLYAECRIYFGAVRAATGRWADAERELDTGLRLTAGTCPGLHARAAVRLAMLRIRQGRLSEADALLTRIGDGERGEEAAALAAVLLARGGAAAAVQHLQRAVQRLDHAHLPGTLDLLVDAHLAVGDLTRADAAARRLADLASTPRLRATADAAAGRVAASSGAPRDAIPPLEAALAEWTRLQRPYEVARARFALAGSLIQDDPEAAVRHARGALDTFSDLGAAPDADRAAAFLRDLGVRARIGPKHAGRLTQREQEVLGLLGAGLSNPEIAGHLHVSRKTAAHHVSHILTKLGLRNRAEAAAYAATAGGPPRRS